MRDEHFDAKGLPRARPLAEQSATLGLVLLFFLALILRLYDLGAKSLWIDELLTIQQGRMPGTTLWEQFLDDVHNPLPMVLITWIGSWADRELWLRLPAALLGAMSVPMLYAVGRVTIGARAALFAALLLAIHPMHIDHSQEVRGYAYMLFFGLTAISLALGAKGRLSLGRAFLLILAGTAAALSNLQGLFWMGGLALGLLVAKRIPLERPLIWTACFLAMLILSAPWWSASLRIHESERLVPGIETGQALRGNTTMTPWAMPYSGLVLSMGRTLGPSAAELHQSVAGQIGEDLQLPRKHLPLAAAAATLLVLLVVTGVRQLGRRSGELLAWASIPIVIAVVLALRNVKPFNPRYILAALPSLLLILAAGLDALRPRWAILALASWLGLSGVSLYRYYFAKPYAHEDVRGAARLIEEREGADDVIVAPTIYRVFEYYFRGESPIYTLHGVRMVDSTSVQAHTDSIEPEKRYLWYVRARPWHDDPKGQILAFMDQNYRRQARFELPGVQVLLFDRRTGEVDDGVGVDEDPPPLPREEGRQGVEPDSTAGRERSN